MATLISIATGNFTSASTWGLVDSTSFLDSEAGSTASTTSYVYSSTFTPGAITIDGVAVKVANRTASPTGTITIELFNNTDTVSVASLTINATDIANSNSAVAYNRGWYFFKFGSNLLVAGKAYKVGFKTSVAGTVTIYRNATAGNWARMLRTTTTKAPAAGDQLHVIGELTGAGTGNSFTVTMDNTASTSFGPTVSGGPPQGITVGKRGTWINGIVASTNYVFKWKGVFAVTDGGTLTIGTHTDPIPASSSVDYIMDSVANVDTGFDFGNGATVTINGDEKFTTTFKTLLNTDEAAAQTVLGMTSTTGWANGDEIVIASTSQTASQCERRTISTVDSSTQVTVSAGLTNAHSGTSPTQAEVGNITRNIKIHGIGTNAPSTTTTLQGYIACAATSSVTIKYAQLYYLGSATAAKIGINVATTTGAFNMQYCSIVDGWITTSSGVVFTGAAGSNLVFSNNVTYNINTTHVQSNNGALTTLDNNLVMLNVAAAGIFQTSINSTVTNNTACGSFNAGFNVTGGITTHSNNTGHSNNQPGLQCLQASGTITGFTSWRNGGNGGILFLNCPELTLINPVCFGNSTQSIGMIGTNYGAFNCLVSGMVSNGDTSFATASGVRFTAGGGGNIIFENCDFSTVSGIKTAHTNDAAVASSLTAIQLTFLNCKLGGTNQFPNQTNMTPNSFVSAQRLGTTAGNHKSWFVGGTLTIDTTIYNTASPSARLTPLSASVKMVSSVRTAPGSGFKKVVASGATLAASIYVRKSVVGDGAAYNGNQPRLIVRKNVAAGISADTVLATASAAAGSWEQLSGTTAAVTDDAVLEFYVDCDGTAGWVNIDDFA